MYFLILRSGIQVKEGELKAEIDRCIELQDKAVLMEEEKKRSKCAAASKDKTIGEKIRNSVRILWIQIKSLAALHLDVIHCN